MMHKRRMDGWGTGTGWTPAVLLLLSISSGLRADPPAHIVDADVDALIERLVTILRERQGQHAEIHINGPIRVDSTGEVLRVLRSYRGTVVARTARMISFRTTDGLLFEVDPEYVDRLDEPGHFLGEKTNLESHGGRTTLATLALVSAGLGRHDRTVEQALNYLERHPMPGTYGRALRASLYSHLVQQSSSSRDREHFYKLLRRDARWLVLAMNDSQGYTYSTHVDQTVRRRRNPLTYDNSNTQFGNLGVWVSALAGCPISRGYWTKVDDFWSRQQRPDGGWGYRRESSPSQNMTIAGINSLILVLDQLYAQSAGPYVRFQGIRRNQRVSREVGRVQQAIQRGRRWLAVQDSGAGEAYTQLGLERLGLASGEKYIGPFDWYREGATVAVGMGGWEYKSIENISMWLMFLTYGRAPVLINKLQWGGPDSGWDDYYRDLYHACRYLSNTYEQLYKWQTIDGRATLYDLQDAPLLYVSGDTEFWLTPAMQAQIREYVERGGTVVGHANRANRTFADSFKRTFEEIFSEWGTEFRKLPRTHDLIGPPTSDDPAEAVPLFSLSDGYRESVILIPVDIAGAWHQARMDRHEDLFRAFAGLRRYAAGAYRDLPGRLRPGRSSADPALRAPGLTVARARTPSDRGGARIVWTVMNELMIQHYGVGIAQLKDVPLSEIDSVPGLDLVHVAGQGDRGFSDDELRAMDGFTRRGGLVLVEALGGDVDFAAVASRQLAAAFPGRRRGAAEDPLVRGAFPRGKPLHGLRYTREGRRALAGSEALPLDFRIVDGSTRVVFSALDLSVSAAGHHVPDVRGFDRLSARKILRNLILYRQSQIASRPPRTPEVTP